MSGGDDNPEPGRRQAGKLSFAALLKTAFRRCAERQLSRIIAVDAFITFLIMIVLMWAAAELFAALSISPVFLEWGWDVTIAAAMLSAVRYCLSFFSFSNFVGCGLIREVLCSEARIGRGVRSGFARWRSALYQLPWYAGMWLLCAVLRYISQRSGSGFAVLLLIIVTYLSTIVSMFLICAVAASDKGVRFGELYNRTFAAVVKGWGRALGGIFMTLLLYIGCFLLICIAEFLSGFIGEMFYAGWGVAVALVLAAAIIILMAAAVWGSFRVLVFFVVYMMNLFVDASGITRAEMGLPAKADGEAETPPTVEVPAAPAAPETEETDPDK